MDTRSVLNLKRYASKAEAEPEIVVEESGRGLLIVDENGDALPAVRLPRSNVVSIKGSTPGAMNAAVELGVEFRYGDAVSEIVIDPSRRAVSAVAAGGGTRPHW